MLNQEIVNICNSLAGTNRRNLVIHSVNPILCEGYNMALVDLLIAIGEEKTANKLQMKAEKLLNNGHDSKS